MESRPLGSEKYPLTEGVEEKIKDNNAGRDMEAKNSQMKGLSKE